MNKISCIAIDDEPLALGLIVSYINKTPYLECCGQFDNPIDAMEYLEDHEIDLILLDIKMPDLTGIEFARTLNKNCKIIFTTAYDKYAVEGFKLHVLDYLLKPISYEVFLNSVNHAKEHFDLLKSTAQKRDIDTDENHLFIKVGYQLQRINYKDVLYFEGLKDYVKLYTEDATKPVIFHSTMKALEEKLPPEKFMRIHRSFIVSLNKIKTIERDRILFGKERIPISRQYKGAFDEYIKQKFL